jgi:hypothetical protein
MSRLGRYGETFVDRFARLDRPVQTQGKGVFFFNTLDIEPNRANKFVAVSSDLEIERSKQQW